MRPTLTLALVSLVSACAARQPPPPPAHTGWTLRYTQRVGEGSAPARDVRPDVGIAVLDGAARIAVRDRGVEARLAPGNDRICRATCAPADRQTALLAVAGLETLPAPSMVRETAPQMERIDEPLAIADVPTQGARFTSSMESAGTTTQFALTVRWIDEPGERSVEVVKAFFLAPLERMGAARLADDVRRTIGLPMHWEIRIVTRRADGSVGEGSVIYHAAEMGNPPAAL